MDEEGPIVVICRGVRQFRRHLWRVERIYPGRDVVYAKSAGWLRLQKDPQLCFLPGWDHNIDLRRDVPVMQALYKAYKVARENAARYAPLPKDKGW